MNNPYMKTPQQLQAEITQMQERYNQQYNRQQNVFSWKYQEFENEVDSLQVPTNGTPFLLIGDGIMYVKKFVNGQTYVTPYSFMPMNNFSKGEEKTIVEEKKTEEFDIKDVLINISKRLEKIENEYNTINKVNKES